MYEHDYQSESILYSSKEEELEAVSYKVKGMTVWKNHTNCLVGHYKGSTHSYKIDKAIEMAKAKGRELIPWPEIRQRILDDNRASALFEL